MRKVILLLLVLANFKFVDAYASDDPTDGYGSWLNEPQQATPVVPTRDDSESMSTMDMLGKFVTGVKSAFSPSPKPQKPKPGIFVESTMPDGKKVYESYSADPFAAKTTKNTLDEGDIVVTGENIEHCRETTPNDFPKGSISVHDPNVNKGLYQKNYQANVERCLRGLKPEKPKLINFRDKNLEMQQQIEKEKKAAAIEKQRKIEEQAIIDMPDPSGGSGNNPGMCTTCAVEAATENSTPVTDSNEVMIVAEKYDWRKCVNKKRESYNYENLIYEERQSTSRDVYITDERRQRAIDFISKYPTQSEREKSYCECFNERFEKKIYPKVNHESLKPIREFNKNINLLDSLKPTLGSFENINRYADALSEFTPQNASQRAIFEQLKQCNPENMMNKLKKMSCYNELVATTVNISKTIKDLYPGASDISKNPLEKLFSFKPSATISVEGYSKEDIEFLTTNEIYKVIKQLIAMREKNGKKLEGRDLNDYMTDDKTIGAIASNKYTEMVFGALSLNSNDFVEPLDVIEKIYQNYTTKMSEKSGITPEKGFSDYNLVKQVLAEEAFNDAKRMADGCMNFVNNTILNPDSGLNVCNKLKEATDDVKYSSLTCNHLKALFCKYSDQREQMIQAVQAIKCSKSKYVDSSVTSDDISLIDDNFNIDNCMESPEFKDLYDCSNLRPEDKMPGFYTPHGADDNSWIVKDYMMGKDGNGNPTLEINKYIRENSENYSSFEKSRRETTEQADLLNGKDNLSNIPVNGSTTSPISLPTASVFDDRVSSTGQSNSAIASYDQKIEKVLDGIKDRQEQLEKLDKKANAGTLAPKESSMIKDLQAEIAKLREDLLKVKQEKALAEKKAQEEQVARERVASNNPVSRSQTPVTTNAPVASVASPVDQKVGAVASIPSSGVVSSVVTSSSGPSGREVQTTSSSSGLSLTSRSMDSATFTSEGGVNTLKMRDGIPLYEIKVSETTADGKLISKTYVAACENVNGDTKFVKYVEKISDIKGSLVSCQKAGVSKIEKKVTDKPATDIETERRTTPHLEWDSAVQIIDNETAK